MVVYLRVMLSELSSFKYVEWIFKHTTVNTLGDMYFSGKLKGARSLMQREAFLMFILVLFSFKSLG